MRFASPVFLALMLAAVSTPALAWGPEGHQIVAAIAARELTPNARAKVGALLGGDADALMVLDASWADEIRDARPETAPWHFVDIEIGSGGYNLVRDCAANNCVVAQILRDEHILSDPRASAPDKAEALRFLIHFAGDLHQPLHAADRHDDGGGKVMLRWRNKRLSLHQMWDRDVVEALGRDSVQIGVQIDSQLSPQQKAQIRAGAPADWANESFGMAANEIYAKLPAGKRVVDDYPDRESAVARLQLARAGLRLAAILNGLFR